MTPRARAWAALLVALASIIALLVVAAVIGTDGTISNATLRSSTLPSPDVESCIVSAVRRWQFPSPESGVVVWNQPFLLVNEEE